MGFSFSEAEMGRDGVFIMLIFGWKLGPIENMFFMFGGVYNSSWGCNSNGPWAVLICGIVLTGRFLLLESIGI